MIDAQSERTSLLKPYLRPQVVSLSVYSVDHNLCTQGLDLDFDEGDSAIDRFDGAVQETGHAL